MSQFLKNYPCAVGKTKRSKKGGRKRGSESMELTKTGQNVAIQRNFDAKSLKPRANYHPGRF